MPATLDDRNATRRLGREALGHEVRDVRDLPDDPDVLKHTIMQLLASLNELAASNAKLAEQLEYMLRRYQGRQSEKMDAAQLALFAAMLGEAAAATDDDGRGSEEQKAPSKQQHQKQKGHRHPHCR